MPAYFTVAPAILLRTGYADMKTVYTLLRTGYTNIQISYTDIKS
ncbi:hypothetical protein SAMN04488053_11722, partial [Alkalicoccus daliensis]